MDNDSKLISEAYMENKNSICPKCKMARLQDAEDGGKQCPSCGYRPQHNGEKSPIGEEVLDGHDIDFENVLYVLQKKGLLHNVNMNSRIVEICSKSNLNSKILDSSVRFKFLGPAE